MYQLVEPDKVMMSQQDAEKSSEIHDSGDSNDANSSENAMQVELEKSREEARVFQDKYLRQAADLENYRRRSEKEKSDLLKFAAEGLVKDLVPVLDSFNQAMGSGQETTTDASGLLEGMGMVKLQLLAALRKHGLEEIPAVGSKFDPNVHQAIQRIEDPDCESEIVAQEFAKGYLLNGRLVRAAMVSVTTRSDS